MVHISSSIFAAAALIALTCPHVAHAVAVGGDSDGIEARMAQPNCQVTVSVKTVMSEAKPKGNIEAVLVKGAQVRGTPGGRAIPDERCVYYYGPDVKRGSSVPLYKGGEWPYVYVAPECTLALDASVPASSPLRKPGYVTVQAGTRLLLIGGLPVYQYVDDEDLTCYCNEPPEWSSIKPDGNGAAFPVVHP